MTISQAVDQLLTSSRGTKAMEDAKWMLDNGACSLDAQNWAALMALLEASRDYPGSTLDAMAEALEDARY